MGIKTRLFFETDTFCNTLLDNQSDSRFVLAKFKTLMEVTLSHKHNDSPISSLPFIFTMYIESRLISEKEREKESFVILKLVILQSVYQHVFEGWFLHPEEQSLLRTSVPFMLLGTEGPPLM